MMKKIIFLVVLLASCASNHVIVNTDNIPYKELRDDASVRNGTPNMYIEQVVDSRDVKSYLGMAKTGMTGENAPIITKEPLVSVVQDYMNDRLMHRGFLVSESSRNHLKIEILSLKIWESPPRTVPERSYCDIIVKASFLSSAKDVKNWHGEFTANITSPEKFDSTKYLSTTFATCIDHLVSKLAKEKTLQSFLSYEYN